MSCLPETIGPVKPNGDELKGVINELKKYVSNPITDNIISFNASTYAGNINNVIMWDGDWASGLGSDYLEISFPRHNLIPTHYSIRSPETDGWYYQKKWSVYGYNSKSDRNNENLWVKLHDGESSEGVFCGTDEFCDDQRTNTFKMNDLTNKKSFKYIRFVNTQPSGSSTHFVTAGIDFYGYLTIDDRLPIMNYPNLCTNLLLNFLLPDSLFVHIFLLK